MDYGMLDGTQAAIKLMKDERLSIMHQYGPRRMA